MLLISKIVELKNDLVIIRQNSEEKDIKIQQLENEIKKLINYQKQTDSLSCNLKCMSKLVESLQREIEKLKDQSSQPQIPIIGGGARVKKSIDEVKIKVKDIENKNLEFSRSVIDMKTKLMENRTMNGEFIWKIDEIDFRMAQAKLDTTSKLLSAPSYTKQCEYKYCISLYLNGDDVGRGTHISIFFIVMKSEYDELLPWPMQTRVTFELINLENKTNSIIDKLVSNPKSCSFQKPTMDMNVPTGCPTFVSIEQFLNGGFIKDNCAFIKTTVKII